jgi:flagellar biosynthesis component FlhA
VLILAVLATLFFLLALYPVQAVLISVGLVALMIARGIYRARSKRRYEQHRMAMEASAEQRKNAREARLQQAHDEKRL